MPKLVLGHKPKGYVQTGAHGKSPGMGIKSERDLNDGSSPWRQGGAGGWERASKGASKRGQEVGFPRWQELGGIGKTIGNILQ